MSSAICFNFDQSKIFSSGNHLKGGYFFPWSAMKIDCNFTNWFHKDEISYKNDFNNVTK